VLQNNLASVTSKLEVAHALDQGLFVNTLDTFQNPAGATQSAMHAVRVSFSASLASTVGSKVAMQAGLVSGTLALPATTRITRMAVYYDNATNLITNLAMTTQAGDNMLTRNYPVDLETPTVVFTADDATDMLQSGMLLAVGVLSNGRGISAIVFAFLRKYTAVAMGISMPR
jgi:hypothetical protein